MCFAFFFFFLVLVLEKALSVKKKKNSPERIVWSISDEHREKELQLTGFTSEEEIQTGEDCLIPMSCLGLVAGFNHLQIQSVKDSLPERTIRSVPCIHDMSLPESFCLNSPFCRIWYSIFLDCTNAQTTYEPGPGSGARLQGSYKAWVMDIACPDGNHSNLSPVGS